MKRYFLVVLFLIPFTLYSQVGVSFGVNISKKTFENAKTITSLQAGLYYDVKMTSQFYIQPNFLFSMGGVKTSKANTEIIAKSNYIELPVYASFRFPLNKEDSFVLNSGLYIAQGIFGKTRIFSDSKEISVYNTFDKMAAFDYGITGGIAYSNKGNSAYFFINVLYGLKSISNPENTNDIGRNFRIRIGLAISLDFNWL